MALEPGQLLQERYRIVALLGEGGMGAVYRAWDTRLNVAVALKEMRPQPGLDQATLAGLRDQFRREATILARLNHPNLVRVTDFFEEGSNAYLVMDFVLGESLADKLLREGAQSEAQVVSWARQLLDALAYCHSEDIIHRDIKPQNVIIHATGKAVLVDFGLVKLWNPNDPRTQTIMRGMGTPEYAPPEQYDTHSSHTDTRSDLYSLGATLYHALTGQAPATATQRMAMPGAFKAPRAINGQISPALEAIISRAMELQLDRRFATAAAMTDALVSQRAAQPFPATIPAAVSPVYQSAGAPPPAPAASGYSPLPVNGNSVASMPAGLAAPPKKRLSPWVWIIGGLGVLILGASIICGALFLIRGSGFFASPTEMPTATANARVNPTSLPELQTPTPRASSPTVVPTESELTIVPSASAFQITVDNYSAYDICYVQISASDSDSWGEDWLGEEELIYSGDSRMFDVPAGTYDVKISDCDDAVLATAWKINQDYSLAVGGMGLVALHLINDSSDEICYVYISSTTADSWGDDWLGESESIASQGGQRVFFFTPGTYDLLTQDCDGNDLVSEFEVDFQSDLDWTISD